MYRGDKLVDFFYTGRVEITCPESGRRNRRACAGAPGLRSRSYFGGVVGSAGRPAAFTEPVRSKREKG